MYVYPCVTVNDGWVYTQNFNNEILYNNVRKIQVVTERRACKKESGGSSHICVHKMFVV